MENLISQCDQPDFGILAALPAYEYERLRPHLEAVHLPPGKNVYGSGDQIEYVYFPLDTVICLFTTMEDGATAEAGIVGHEGLLGISALMGVKKMFNHSTVLNSSVALRINSEVLKREFDAGGYLQNLLLRYIHALYVQISQTAACNRIHQIEARLCRWLLMTHDRLKNDCLTVTQEFIAQMLGTRRPYITIAAGILHKKGVIHCRRGRIKVLDRRKLEEFACECYAIIQSEFSFLC